MTVVLWDINSKKRRDNDKLGETDVTDWTIDEYYEIAKRCILSHASPPLAQSMLKSEDALSFMAEHLMYAAFRWREGKGRTVNSYLNQCAIWAIKGWVRLSNRASQHSMLSINTESHPDSRTQMYELLEDENSEVPDVALMKIEKSNNISSVIDDAGLTERQRHCIEVVYVQGQRPSEVARDLGISRQAVDQCLHKGIDKIRMATNGKTQEILT